MEHTFDGEDDMSDRLVVLDLVLRELGVDPEISTLTKRKRIQKAIYLAQAAGVDLGYRYGWYVKGPYSTQLTRDYYELTPTINRVAREKRLKEPLNESLGQLRPLLVPPQDSDLVDADWMELLSSIHYLGKVRRETRDGVIEVLRKEKPVLADHADIAFDHLEHYALI